MEDLVIEVEQRSSTGKGVNRKLRQEGLIPAVVYGGGKEPVPVIVNRHAVTELLRQEKGLNTVFLLKMKGTKNERQAMLRDAQIDPLTQQYIHLDFIRVMKGQAVRVDVPIALEGESHGVKAGGFMEFVSRTLHVECPPDAIPPNIPVDVTQVGLGEHVAAGDLQLPEGVKLLDDPTKVIAVVAAHGMKAVTEAEEGAGAAVESEADKSEPQVIRRGKAGEGAEAGE